MDKKIALLNKKEILETISKASLNKLDSLIVSKKTGSTNDDAKNTLKESEVNLCAHFAEQQNSGRGRGGKNWTSPFAKNIYFSMGWNTNLTLSEIEGLSLAVGVVVAEALQKFINESIKIKWPNDLFVRGQKIAGILIEQRADRYLVGIGINVLEAPIPSATCLRECGSDALLPVVVDVAIGSVFDAAQLNENTAVSEWKKRDILMGTKQTIRSGGTSVEGTVISVDPCNTLILQTSEALLEFPAATSTIVTSC